MVDASALVNTGPFHIPVSQEHTVAPAEQSMTRNAQREQRAARILDAAGDLLVTWGYPKITIEDVARRAGVGKGTVYLHFPTKEVLFLVVVLRAQSALTEQLASAMRRSPEEILPSAMARSVYLSMGDSPVISAVMTGKSETLGTLARTAAEHSRDLVSDRITTSHTYFDLLIEHDLLRSDRPRNDLVYAYTSVMTGYLLAEPILASQPGLPQPESREHRADVLADSIRATLGEGGTTDALAAAWPEVATLYEELARRARAEVDRYLQSTRDT
ncbi:TetR/AcrR family transcriptional regulator [Nocardiopsis aegyptia]|uniref:AcrR family transcriptional regulator n=1 Tax=Nocardiopsis aegyptia TaxID=220378 RepID=A0A7Z0EK91_9ACTN|nr:TetR/AcrR family transcriptional regulator [Nocardiopsis aegyptia]NYJ33584.1 AcrR family transcriptional regulator [Nocardiopsis aegyptia]